MTENQINSALLKEPLPLRLKFTKTGKMKYISHLDLNRAFTHAFLRADIPVWHTEGFNPHPKIIFSLPLPLGVESICEFLDFKITKDVSPEKIKKALNDTLPDGFEILDIYQPAAKFSEITHAGYEIEITSERIT